MDWIKSIDKEWFLLAGDVAFAALCYTLYRKKSKIADQLRAAPNFMDLDNREDVLFAFVEGNVKPKGTSLKSAYTEENGVIRYSSIVEHKTKKTGGYWHDATHIINDSYKTVPFNLITQDPSQVTIAVDEPLSARLLENSLSTTYSHFEPQKTGISEKILERLFGDVSKGIQETEKLLPVGTQMIGFGRLLTKNGRIHLEPPKEDFPYILTSQTRRQVISTFENHVSIFKVLTYLFGIVGISIAGYIAYKQYKKWASLREMRRLRNEVLQARERQENNDNNSNRECVVCLTNQREVVLLECAHICICMDCALALPEPKHCPVCRAPVAGIRAVFYP